ncbi:MAG: protein TonB [Saprospiraceae bacterium]|jgi:protein TonB
MEFRKNEKSNLENKKTVFFLVGMLLILSCTYAALNMKSFSKLVYDFDMQVEDDLTELPPITTPPPPPPPPPPAEKPPVEPEIQLVEDEVITEIPDFDDTELDEVEIDDEPVGDDSDEELADVPMVAVSNYPTYPECAHLKTNNERNRCTQNLIHSKVKELFDMPAIAQELELEDVIYVKFVVNKQGVVGAIEILKGKHDILNKEAIRAVGLLPKLNPGMNLDRPASVIYTIPIRIVY